MIKISVQVDPRLKVMANWLISRAVFPAMFLASLALVLAINVP